MLNFCSYPSRVEYNNVVSALLLDYPFLKDYDGSAVSHAHVFLLFVMIRIVCFFVVSMFIHVALILKQSIYKLFNNKTATIDVEHYKL